MEDATEFLRRIETYLKYKGSDNGDKLRLATAMLVSTARDWLENLPKERKNSFAHLKLAFTEKFIQPANDIFKKQQLHSESVDEYANRIKNLGKRIEFDNSTLMYALLNALKSAIKGQVLVKNPESFAKAADGARLAELSAFVSTSPTEKLITKQLAQMRCDIQQLTGKGTVNDRSLTTLATEEATRSPYRHRVEFVLTKQTVGDHHGHNTPSRDHSDQCPQETIRCLRNHSAETSKCRERMTIGDFTVRIIGNL